MNPSLRRAIFAGLFSQTLAVCAMFVIAGGLFSNGHQTAVAFFLTALGLCFIIFTMALTNSRLQERGLLVSEVIALAAGIGTTVIVLQNIRPFQLLLFAIAGIFLLQRLNQLIVLKHPDQIRRSLLEQYRLDVAVMIGLAVVTLLLEKESHWQTMAVPFFASFLLVRMTALSFIASTAIGTAQKRSRLGRMSILLVGTAALGGWVLNVIGIPVVKSLLVVLNYVLQPLFYVVGLIGTFVTEWILANRTQGQEDVKKMLDGMREEQSSEESLPMNVDASPNLDWVVYSLAAIGCVIVLRFVYKRLKQRQEGILASGSVEIREFIHRPNSEPSANRLAFSSVPLTPMRAMYREFLLRMKQSGYRRSKGETSLEFANRLSSKPSVSAEQLRELTDYYMRERYSSEFIDVKKTRVAQLADNIVRKYKEK